MKVLQHDKRKEREAVSRKTSSNEEVAAGSWLMNVPFPGLGMSNIRLSLGEILNFATTVSALDPAPGDLVLDLGAGSCWVSDWLNRLLVDTVSLDISHDMLSIGKQRLPSQAALTVGDSEGLPFLDNTFNGAIFVSSLHHLPNIPDALREVYRVLRDDGAVVFSEPGRGHASHPQSRAEMEELGVMERDVMIDELLDVCREAGFQMLKVYPFLFPLLSYDDMTWQHLQEGDSGASPRVTHSTQLGLLDRIKGLLQGALTSDRESSDFGEEMSQVVRRAVEMHPIVVARKGQPRVDSRRPDVLRADISVRSFPKSVTGGSHFHIRLIVENRGDTLWLSEPKVYGGFVTLGAKLVNKDRLVLRNDYAREILPKDVEPGESVKIEFGLIAPGEPGSYYVKFDMVDECIAWFEHHGSEPAFIPLEVR